MAHARSVLHEDIENGLGSRITSGTAMKINLLQKALDKLELAVVTINLSANLLLSVFHL